MALPKVAVLEEKVLSLMFSGASFSIAPPMPPEPALLPEKVLSITASETPMLRMAPPMPEGPVALPEKTELAIVRVPWFKMAPPLPADLDAELLLPSAKVRPERLSVPLLNRMRLVPAPEIVI